MITRRMDWRSQLLQWSNAQVGRDFAWGLTDCGTLVRAALSLCFGQDVFPTLPQWRTVRQAATVLQRYGPAPKILLEAGAVKMPFSFVRTGDILYMPEPEESIGRAAMGVWIDDRCLTSSADGVQMMPRQAIAGTIDAYSLWEVAVDG